MIGDVRSFARVAVGGRGGYAGRDRKIELKASRATTLRTGVRPEKG